MSDASQTAEQISRDFKSGAVIGQQKKAVETITMMPKFRHVHYKSEEVRQPSLQEEDNIDISLIRGVSFRCYQWCQQVEMLLMS